MKLDCRCEDRDRRLVDFGHKGDGILHLPCFRASDRERSVVRPIFDGKVEWKGDQRSTRGKNSMMVAECARAFGLLAGPISGRGSPFSPWIYLGQAACCLSFANSFGGRVVHDPMEHKELLYGVHIRVWICEEAVFLSDGG